MDYFGLYTKQLEDINSGMPLSEMDALLKDYRVCRAAVVANPYNVLQLPQKFANDEKLWTQALLLDNSLLTFVPQRNAELFDKCLAIVALDMAHIVERVRLYDKKHAVAIVENMIHDRFCEMFDTNPAAIDLSHLLNLYKKDNMAFVRQAIAIAEDDYNLPKKSAIERRQTIQSSAVVDENRAIIESMKK